MQPRFPAYLAAAIAAKGFTKRQFALLVGCKPQNLHSILKGTRRLPVKHVSRWSAALAGAIDPELFRILSLLEECPDEIRRNYLRMMDRR